MESYLYESDPCCLCWFSTTWADLDLRTDLNFLWRQNIRVIGLPSPGDEAFLTGSGFFLDADDDIVFASHDPDVSVSYNSQSNPLAMGLPEIDVEKARDRSRVFILHDICWLMLFDCVADRQISRRPLLVKSLYGLLCSMPCGAEGCSLSHRAAEGLPQFVLGRRLSCLHARPGVSDYSFKNALLRGNPAALGLSFENKLVANISAMSPSLLDNTKPVNWSSDPFFSKMLAEINTLIISFLPSSDVCHFQFASRTVAQPSRPRDLPHFWRTRFNHGHEMDFYKAGENDRGRQFGVPVDWRNLYGRIRSALGDTTWHAPEWSHHLRAKQLIMRALDPISRCLEPALDETFAIGYRDSTAGFAEPASVIGGAVVRPENPHHARNYAKEGNETLASQVLWLPRGPLQGSFSVKASFRTVCHREYICGLRIVRYRLPNNETRGHVDEISRV